MKSGAVSSASKSSPPAQVISSSVNSALVLFLTPLFPEKKNSTKENMNLPVIITSLLGLIYYVLQLLKSFTFKPYHSQDLIY